MERGVVCEVTPTGLLMVGDGLLSLRRTYRGNLGNHSPLHSERGWGWGFCGCKVLWYLYAGGLLWNAVCSVLLCKSVRKKRLRLAVGRFFFYAGYVFLSQSAQSSRSFLRTVSSPQNASGIQSSQSVIAKGGCWVLGIRCWGLAIDGWWVIVVRC